MHIVITGANGFVGHALAHHLAQRGELGGRPIRRLSLLDLSFDQYTQSRVPVDHYAGDLADTRWLNRVLGTSRLDSVFHLASLPGGLAEQNYALARAVNLEATQGLLELGKQQVEAGGPAPRFVFASSIAALGELSGHVTDDTPLRPQLTYGAQKLIGEIMLADFSRRGWVDGRSLRLPGILARPAAPTGQLSAFLSDIIRALKAGQRFVCPTSANATTWAVSLPCAVDALMQGAIIEADNLPSGRALTLPTLCFAMQDLVAAIGDEYGTPVDDLIQWQPDERVQALFGSFPTLDTAAADRLGFRHDGDLKQLVRQALVESEAAGA
ncbi:NAD-dependent epimerase/dehydratase family protein [Amphritea sp.]|uniref:NAD-dependent epimerase/dehydratase family protein n=1 Tax=Amphritea sp. TaxID=1872502 RepID=UPI003A90DA80